MHFEQYYYNHITQKIIFKIYPYTCKCKCKKLQPMPIINFKIKQIKVDNRLNNNFNSNQNQILLRVIIKYQIENSGGCAGMEKQKQGKPNFIEEMRRKLNMYHIERMKKMQQNEQNRSYYKEQARVKNMLMEMDHELDLEMADNEKAHDWNDGEYNPFVSKASIQDVQNVPNWGEDISGWNSTRPTNYCNNYLNTDQKERSTQRKMYTLRRNAINSMPSKTLGYEFEKKQKNPDMINYLKTLLTRLQSPMHKDPSKQSKKCIKTQNTKRNNDENTTKRISFKNNQAIERLKQSKLNLFANRTNTIINKKIQKALDPKQSQLQVQVNKQQTPVKEKQGQKFNFQIIDIGSTGSQPRNAPTQNWRPNPLSSSRLNSACQYQNTKYRAVSEYKKIKRNGPSACNRNNNQYQLDVAHEKNILQQLISGRNSNQHQQYQHQYAESSGYRSSQKFTLKNLLC